MKTLAKALIDAAAFFELSGDDAVNPDDAVKALESISHTLHAASSEEIAALREVLRKKVEEERAGLGRADLLKFYEHFLESFGVAE